MNVRVLYAGLALVAAGAAVAQFLAEGGARLAAANTACTAAATCALLGTLSARRVGRSWRVLAAASGVWLAGQLLWIGQLAADLGAGTPFRGPTDVLWLLFPALAAVGVYQLAPASTPVQALARLDAIALAAAAAGIAVAFGLRLAAESELGDLAAIVVIAYPASYAALAAVLAEAIFGSRAAVGRPAFGMLLAGFVVEAVAFALWVPDRFAQSYVQGTTASDVLWPAGLLLIGLGGLLAAVRPALASATDADRRFRGVLTTLALLVLLLVVAGFTIVDRPIIERLVATVALAVVGAIEFARTRLLLAEREAMLAEVRSAYGALERVNRELDAFAYTASHDLRAPLVSIDGLAASLGRRLGDGVDGRVRDYLTRIRANAAMLQRLIQDVLDYARAGTIEVPSPIDPLPVVQNAAESARRAGAAVEVVAPLPQIRAHPVRLQQALTNLLDNAVRHGGRNDDLRVRVSGAMLGGPFASIVVEDNGKGIDPETQKTMFELFAKGPSGQSGVGLAIVKRIVESGGGVVRYERAARGGSRFILDLPKGDPA